MKTVFVLLALLTLAGCVDGRTGEFFICGVTTPCQAQPPHK